MGRAMTLRTWSWIITGAFALVATLAGCERAERVGESSPRSAPSSPESDDRGEDERYDLKLANSDLRVGEETTTALRIRAGEGLKPNREFPAWSLELESPDGVRLDSTSWNRDDFTLESRRATVDLPIEATRAGDIQLQGHATFSVCNDQTCHVLRDEPVTLSLTARPADDETT